MLYILGKYSSVCASQDTNLVALSQGEKKKNCSGIKFKICWNWFLFQRILPLFLGISAQFVHKWLCENFKLSWTMYLPKMCLKIRTLMHEKQLNIYNELVVWDTHFSNTNFREWLGKGYELSVKSNKNLLSCVLSTQTR